MTISWTEKYAPKKSSEIIGQLKLTQDIKNFVKIFPNVRKKALLLYGPSGTGKTCIPKALAEEVDYELVEINASDKRNKIAIDAQLGPASQQSSIFGDSKIILVDEVDHMSGTKDRGGPGAVATIVKDTKFPIILTANDPWESKLKSLRKECTLIEVRAIDHSLIIQHLKNILKKEGIEYQDSAIRKIALHSDGDLRAAINDLQMLSQGQTELTEDKVSLWVRDSTETIFNTMKLIFKSFDSQAALRASNELAEDLDMLNLWLEENIAKEYTKPQELKEAYNHLASSNIFLSRIMRRQHWRFLVYSRYLSVAGVQQSKQATNPKFIKHNPPELLRTLFIRAAKRKKSEAITKQAADKLHTSSRVLQRSFLPYYEKIALSDPGMAKEIDKFLGI